MTIWNWTRRGAALAAAAVLLAACGGGGGVDTGGTGSYTHGSISGFGSVIVNAVRFDDSTAAIVDDDGNTLARSALALGMRAEIDAGAITAGAAGSSSTAKATRIRISSDIVGPVQSVDALNQTVTVLGQTVRIDAATVFAGSLPAKLGSLSAGAVVEVHALPEATSGRYLATRIEPKAAPSAWRLRGVVAALDAAGQTFQVGTLRVSYDGLAAPAGLANGRIVKLRLETTPTDGVYAATRLEDGAETPSDREDAKLEGLVTALTSARLFSVGGVAVDARDAEFPDGAIVLGGRVEVEGALVGGVLVARKVELEDEDESSAVELDGPISALDTNAQTFVLKGFTVRYSDATEFDDNTTPADLKDGVGVEVRGTLGSSDTVLVAERIKFDR